jgi:exopolysaccharide production protein ExoZ
VQAAGKTLVSIQAARGVAALLVALMHAGRMLSLPQYVGYVPLDGIFSFGHAGVDFFFVLSGFIIFYVHHRDIGRPDRLGRYGWRRFVRIYPIYWIVTGAALGLAVLGHKALSAEHVFVSVALLPQSGEPVVGVAWTLEHEVLFYALFGLLIANYRVGIAAFGCWAVLIGAEYLERLPGALLPFLASSYHLHFFLGILCAWLVLADKIRYPLLLTTLGIVIFFAAGIAENEGALAFSGAPGRPLFGIGAACVIAGLAAAERVQTIRFGALAEFFGGASYSLYLIHTTIIGLTAHALQSAHAISHLAASVALGLCIALSVAAALTLYGYVEAPLLARLKSVSLTTLARG